MKSIIKKVAAAAALVALLVYAWTYDPNPLVLISPEDVRLDPKYERLYYHHSGPNPFPGDRFFLSRMISFKQGDGEDRHYVFDLNAKKISGALRNGYFVAYSPAYQTYLVFGAPSEPPKVISSIKKYLGISSPVNGIPPLRLGLLSTVSGKVKWLKTVTSTGRGELSPDGRYYRSGGIGELDHYVVDFQERKIIHMPPAQTDRGGWWSNREIVYQSPLGTLNVHDVENDSKRTLVSSHDLKSFLTSHQLDMTYQDLFHLYVVWTGSGYEFFLASNYKKTVGGSLKGKANESWLIHIDKKTEELKLVDADFTFRRVCSWNADMSKYLYHGERETKDSSAVYILDMKTKEENKLFWGGPNADYFSCPRFYNDRIIFAKEKSLWMMDLDGGNKERIFP